MNSSTVAAFPVRISVCARDPQKAAAFCEKLKGTEGLVFLKPLWEQPELIWAADVVVLAGEDIVPFQKMGALPFCPAIVLETGMEDGVVDNIAEILGRIPFAAFPVHATAQQIHQLIVRACANTRMTLAGWHSRMKKNQPNADTLTLKDEPALSLDSILYWLRNWQAGPDFYKTLGEMFYRWSGSGRVMLLTCKGHTAQEELEIQYCSKEQEQVMRRWVWYRSEPWVKELERCADVVRRDCAGPELFRWMEALKIQYMVPLRHQDVFLGILAFTDRAHGVGFTQKDWAYLGVVAAKIGQTLYLWQQSRTMAAVAGTVPTAEKAAEQTALPIPKEMMRRQQLEIIGRMAMRSSHELKNCLVSIRTFAQLFPEKYTDEQFRKDFYGVVNREVERLNSLVEKLLFFAQPVQLKLTQEKITDVIHEAIALFSPEDFKNCQLHKIFSHKQPTVWLDRQQMVAVFFHILQNSLQALGGGGKLVIVTEDHSHPDFSEGVLVVRLLDTGRGVTVKDPEEPFEPFYSTKARGMGLGLTIARRVVEEHGGTIRLTSAKDKGTEVILCLPRKIPHWDVRTAPSNKTGVSQ